MFLYYCTGKKHLSRIRRDGLRRRRGIRLFFSLKAVRAACDKKILVIDTARLPGEGAADRIPPEAIVNLDPYFAPRPVVAGGGYVMRRGEKEPEVLLIFRRAVWDLPKGKQDKGETVEACALREVREETDARDLVCVCDLGTTRHGYIRNGHYDVKTTHWFGMSTPTTHFTPQAEEDIEAVAWTPWSEAQAKIGYESLRQHMTMAAPRIGEAFGWPDL